MELPPTSIGCCGSDTALTRGGVPVPIATPVIIAASDAEIASPPLPPPPLAAELAPSPPLPRCRSACECASEAEGPWRDPPRAVLALCDAFCDAFCDNFCDAARVVFAGDLRPESLRFGIDSIVGPVQIPN